jgi:hypothetical protein
MDVWLQCNTGAEKSILNDCTIVRDFGWNQLSVMYFFYMHYMLRNSDFRSETLYRVFQRDAPLFKYVICST